MSRISLALAVTISCAGLSAQAPTFTIFNGDSAGDRFGASVSGAGDVDADGFDDFIVSARFDDNNGSNSGSARVFSGQTGAILYTFNGDSVNDWFGTAVSGAGDVDGDGFHDLVVGTDTADLTAANSGSARVFSGDTGAILYTFNGWVYENRLGESVSGAGDVNADGFDDIIAGTMGGNYARVFSGKNGDILHSFYGSISGGIGQGGGAGDVDADGFDDLIVGASVYVEGFAHGAAKVFSGKTGVLLYTFTSASPDDSFGNDVSGAGDVDADGFDDLIVGDVLHDSMSGFGRAVVYSGRTGTLLYTVYGDSADDGFGTCVSGAGDVDGDGFDDFIVGAPFDDNNGSESGSARLFSGKTGTVLDTFDGDSAGDYFGCDVSGAGDVDADGFDELIVGAINDDNNGSNSGSAKLIDLNLTGTPPRMRIFGTACLGSNGNLPHADYRRRLAVGEPIDFLLRGALPSTTCTMVLAGATNIDLGTILPGLAGCWQYAATDYIWSWTTTDIDGMAGFLNVPIPNSPDLVGLPINAQWGCLDPAANPFGATTSNGLEMVIGT